MSEPFAADLAHTPRSLRVRLDLTQARVAEIADVEVQTVAAIEAGDQGVGMPSLTAVARALQVPLLVLVAAWERVRDARIAREAAEKPRRTKQATR